MATPLKVWNGPVYVIQSGLRDRSYNPRDITRIYVCAASKAAAVRLMTAFNDGFGRGILHEMNTYFSPHWGDAMVGITPTPGIWIQQGHHDTPTRVC